MSRLLIIVIASFVLVVAQAIVERWIKHRYPNDKIAKSLVWAAWFIIVVLIWWSVDSFLLHQ